MNRTLRHVAAGFLGLAGIAGSARADLTNTWPFTDPLRYTVSKSTDIEVADGLAKLKLQAATVSLADLQAYFRTNAVWENNSFGPDVLISLAKVGNLYASRGEFISRIVDGGLGNRWDSFNFVGYNTSLLNAGGEVQTTMSGLALLAHMNNDWRNEVTGTPGVPSNGAEFTTDARLGSHSGLFPSANAGADYARSLTFGQQMSCAFWFNPIDIDFASIGNTINLSNFGTQVGFVEIGGSAVGSEHVADNIELYMNSQFAQAKQGTMTAADEGTWNHIAVVYDNTQPSNKTRIYKNGVRLEMSRNFVVGAIPAFNSIRIGGRGIFTQCIRGKMDEVCIFNRALSDKEVGDLYRMPQSLLFQARSAGSPSEIVAKEFTGWDGTAQSYYSKSLPDLVNSPQFSRVDRYVQYKAILIGQPDGKETSFLDSIGIVGTRASAFDNTLGDFIRGVSRSNLDILPDAGEKGSLALSKQPNGGYHNAGTYTSRTLDAGAQVFWNVLNWQQPAEIGSETGLLALWHANGGWADATGHGYNGQSVQNIGFSSYAKLGSQSAVFNGASSSASFTIPGSVAIGTVEFWVNTPSFDDGIMDFGGGKSILIKNRMIVASGFVGNTATVFVNGQFNSRLLLPGWNHVALVFASPFTVTGSLVIGRAGADYYNGMLDEIALYTKAIDGGKVKSHYLQGGGTAAGTVKFQVRAANQTPIPDSAPFIGPGNSPSAYFVATGVGLPSEVWQKRYFQYRAYLESDGNASPAVYSVSVDYSGLATGTQKDSAAAQFNLGHYDSGATRWAGTQQASYDNAVVPGLVNLDPVNEVGIEGLWHLDEETWSTAGSVADSSGNARNGDPQGAALPSGDARVGLRCGSFSGSGQYLILPSVTLTADLTAEGWFRTTASTRAAVVARSDGGFILEINGDGTAQVPGTAAFVVKKGATRKVAVAAITSLNDGGWHHIAGVRKDRGIYVYIDGVRVGSALLPAGFGALGVGQMEVARHPETGGFLAGNVDEVAVYSRGLTDADLTQAIAAGRKINTATTYQSMVFDAGGPAIWESLAWSENGPYGETLSGTDLDVVGLWHMDAVAGGQVVDASSVLPPNHGTLAGTYALGTGKFGGALNLSGLGSVTVPDTVVLEPENISVVLWVRMTDVENRAILEKRNGGTGYALFTDSDGKPVFRVGATNCTANGGMRSGEWVHLAGVYDGATARIYLDGKLAGLASVSGASMVGGALMIGASSFGAANFSGDIDEVAVYARALNQEEVADHARMGFGDLRFQARAGDTPTLDTATFVGSDGTAGSYFTRSSDSPMIGAVPLGRYFQLRMELTTVDGLLAPIFQGASIKQSRYTSDNPWVRPAAGEGVSFLGRLLGFSHVLQQNTDAAVRYQVSGSGTNWYWWNGAQWQADSAGEGWTKANPVATVNAQIQSLYDQVYPKVGGSFFFRAFLHSEGNDQTAIDAVKLTYSRGSITVLSPNGTEINEKSWLVDTPYPIRWTSAGQVSNNLRIEYSRDGGANWVTIASGEANDKLYPNWRTPPAPSQQMLVRVSDLNDASIFDQSDAVFHVTDVFQVTAPNGGEKWYMTETNRVRWASPGPAAARGSQVDIRYAADGANFTFAVARFAPNTEGSTNNAYAWYVVPGLVPMPLPSVAGRIRVHAADNTTPEFNGQDDSDLPFALYGITITNPGDGSYVNNGQQLNLKWTSAGAGDQVAVDFSRNNGTTWTNVLASIANSDGDNQYAWTVELAPSDEARLRMRSLSDPKVRGVSAKFQLADIKVTAPGAGENWELRQTKTIRWESGGAGDRVDLYYSRNGGTSWTLIESNVLNVVSNAYTWKVEPYPTPSARIRVVAQADPENLRDESPNFNIAGVRIVFPSGGEIWPRGGTDAIRWEHNAAGSIGNIYTSLDGGGTWTFLGARGLANLSINWRPEQPSARALARIDAESPPVWAVDMKDVSDAYFTIGGIVVTSPTNSQLVTVGQTTSIGWTSAGALDSGGNGFARIYYTATGGTTSNFVAEIGNNEIYPGNNNYSWSIPDTLPPSLNAQIIVTAGPFRGLSQVFTLRGMRFTSPTDTSVFDLGRKATLRWDYAGLNDNAAGFIFLSADGGATFGAEAINAAPVYVSSGIYDWQVPSNATPSTVAVLKFVVQTSPSPQDINYEVRSRPFVLRGLKIVRPKTGDAWAHSSSNQINLVASRAGNFATFYYAADGVNYDMAAGHEVRKNWPLQDGVSFIPWTVESYRQPSLAARLKAVSAVATAVSEPFAVHGVKVLRPSRTDIWAVGETNTVVWAAEGTTGAYDIFVEAPGGGSVQIANGVGGSTFAWLTTPAVVGTGVVVRVRDAGGYQGVSEPFRVVAQPTVIVVNPAANALWPVSSTFSVTWSKGGAMSNDFWVGYSPEPYAETNRIFSGPAAYDAVNNTYSVPWTIPNRLGAAKVVVINNDRGAIRDTSATFFIVGKFQLIFPNGGEQTLFALKPTIVRWYTQGSVAAVNLFYSIDPLHPDGSWVKINAAPLPVTGFGTEPSSYEWKPVDLGGSVNTVRLRVEQADRPGALDESDADFPINYYTIVWNVLDEKTGQHLNKLSITESTGSSQSGLLSPVTRKYPYGYFDTIWSREYFYDNVNFNWLSEPSRSVQVSMKRSDVDPDYNVMANFTYEGGVNDRLSVYAWIERGGAVQTDPTKCTVFIYNVDGSAVTNLLSTAPQPNTGVFRFNWDQVTRTLTRGETYYAKVEIEYSGQTYSSVVTYTLRLTAEATDTDALQGVIGAVSNNLTNLADAQALFRGATTKALGNLLTNTAAIGAGVSRIETNLAARVVPSLDLLTNAVVGVIAPAVTSTLARVTALASQIDARTARILTRDAVVALNSVNTILYKTRPGYGAGVTLAVTRADGTPVVGARNMAEIVGGIYQLELTANWGLGGFIVTCTDPGGVARDSTPLRVVARDLYDVPVMMASMSNDISNLQVEVANMSASLGSVTSAATRLDAVIDRLSTLTNLDALSTALKGIDFNALTNVVTLAGKVEEIRTGVQDMQATLGALTNLPELANSIKGLNLSGLSNLTALSSDVADIMTSVTKLQGSSAGVSNRLAGLDTAFRAVPWSALTNIETRVGDIQTALGALTNLNAIIAAIDRIDLSTLTNVTALASDISKILTEVGGVNTAVGSLTNLPASVAQLSNRLGPLTNIETRVGDIQARMTVLTNIEANIDQVRAALGALTNLAEIATAIKGIDLTSLTNLTALSTDIASILGEVTGTRGSLSMLTNIQLRVTEVQTALGALTNLDAIAQSIQKIDVSTLTNVSTLASDIATILTEVGGVGTAVGSLTNIQKAVAQLGTRMGALTNIESRVESIDTRMGALTNLGSIAKAIASLDVAALSNLTTVADDLARVQRDVKSLTNGVAALNTSIGGVDWNTLTNVPGIASDVNTLLAQVGALDLSPVSNLAARVQTITNALGRMNWSDVLGLADSMAAVTGGVASIEAVVNRLGNLTALAGLQTSLSNAVGQVQTSIDGIDGRLSGISVNSAQAASKSRSAKTEASKASSGIRQLSAEFEKGDVGKVAEILAGVRQALDEAKQNVDEIPKLIGPEKYHEKVIGMASVIQELASRKGFRNFLTLETPSEGATGAGPDKDAIGVLSRNFEELKGSLQLMQKLMDAKLNEPVVQSTLLGVE